MTKYIYRRILRKPSTDLQFFEEYLESANETARHQVLLSMFEELWEIYNLNSTFTVSRSSTEHTVYVEYTREELEKLIAAGENLSIKYHDIYNEWMKYTLNNDIYYSATLTEVFA
jgi:hypothetical protein